MNRLPESPTGHLLDHLKTLTPDALRERVTTLTGADLDQLVRAMEGANAVPEIFKNSDILVGIEHQIEKQGVQEDVRNRWLALKHSIESNTAAVTNTAEKGFLQHLLSRGGGMAVLGISAITVLSWLGFSKAKKLRASLREKGYLRTAIEGAKEHPIFAAFIAAMGVKAGSEAFRYLSENRSAIESRIESIAGQTGKSVASTTIDIAEKARSIIGTGVDAGLGGLVKGLSFALGGEYDEETGVVTLPHADLRPPFIIAWQSGIRRRGGPEAVRGLVSKFVMEDRLNAILRQTDVAIKQTQAGGVHKKRLAERALDLMKSGTVPGAITRESLELERIFDTLSDDLKLSKADMAREVRYRPREAAQRVELLQAEMERLHTTEVQDFRTVKDAVQNRLYEAERQLAKGTFRGSAANVKEEAVRNAQERIKTYQDELVGKKLAIGEQLTDALNHLTGEAGHSSVVRERGLQQLDDVTAGGGWKSNLLESATSKAEKIGYGIRKIPGGKYVVRGLVGYSFLPLALEGVAALRAGEKGGEARKAVMLDATEAGLGFVPFVGEAMDLRAAFMGTDLNGRELSTMQRVTSGAMGALGAASIALGFFTGGLSVVGFRAVRGILASRRAVKTLKLAEEGVEIASVTQKSIKAIRAGEKNAERLESMLQVTNTQRKLRGIKNVVDNAQRTMQVATYAHLGYNLASGVAGIYGNVEDFVGKVQNTGLKAVDAVESFVRPATPH